jgi:hypothetical protein
MTTGSGSHLYTYRIDLKNRSTSYRAYTVTMRLHKNIRPIAVPMQQQALHLYGYQHSYIL